MIMKRNEKMSMLAELLKKGNNRFTVEELVEAAGSAIANSYYKEFK
jgi:hypothetical protein